MTPNSHDDVLDDLSNVSLDLIATLNLASESLSLVYDCASLDDVAANLDDAHDHLKAALATLVACRRALSKAQTTPA